MAKHYSSVSEASWVTLLNLSGEAPLGDYTVMGKIITSFMGLVGVGFVTIPMGVLGSGFQDLLEDDDEEDDAPAAAPAAKESRASMCECSTEQRAAAVCTRRRAAFVCFLSVVWSVMFRVTYVYIYIYICIHICINQ